MTDGIWTELFLHYFEGPATTLKFQICVEGWRILFCILTKRSPKKNTKNQKSLQRQDMIVWWTSQRKWRQIVEVGVERNSSYKVEACKTSMSRTCDAPLHSNIKFAHKIRKGTTKSQTTLPHLKFMVTNMQDHYLSFKFFVNYQHVQMKPCLKKSLYSILQCNIRIFLTVRSCQ